jgi:hypothetical protein
MDELRRERDATLAPQQPRSGPRRARAVEVDAERRRRERIEGWPPPWVPTIFVKKR